MKRFLQLTIPAMLMFCLEWGAFQFLVLMAGYLGEYPLAAQVILNNVCWLFYYIAYGVSVATTTLVGNSLGANNPKTAKLYAKMILVFSILMNLSLALLLYFLKHFIAKAYTSD